MAAVRPARRALARPTGARNVVAPVVAHRQRAHAPASIRPRARITRTTARRRAESEEHERFVGLAAAAVFQSRS